MRAPNFWYESSLKGKVFSTLLFPISCIYQTITQVRCKQSMRRSFPLPMIIIGNIILGGSGKTPLTLWLGEMLKQAGMRVLFLSKGYKGETSKSSVSLIDHFEAAYSGTAYSELESNIKKSKEYGDEAVLLSQVSSTVVGYNRLKVLHFILQHLLSKVDVVVCDDGLQNPYLPKALRILVVNLEQGFGNHRIFPAGPLRESLEHALQRCQIIIAVGGSDAQYRAFNRVIQNKPIFRTTIIPVLDSALPISSKVLAFCGIAYPNKFFNSLKEVGYEIKKSYCFPDHYVYKKEDIEKLYHRAEKEKLTLITTEKDWVKLPSSMAKKIHILKIKVAMEKEEEMKFLIQTYIKDSLEKH